jgi:transposase
VSPLPPGVRVLIATRPVDFRKGANSLAALTNETLAQDAFCGAVLVFRSRRADPIKILVWDDSGLVLIWQRLEQGAFKWPPITDGVMRLSPAQLAAFVEGLDRTRVHVPRIARRMRGRAGNAVVLVFCWDHWRRRFYEIAKAGSAPIAEEAQGRSPGSTRSRRSFA